MLLGYFCHTQIFKLVRCVCYFSGCDRFWKKFVFLTKQVMYTICCELLRNKLLMLRVSDDKDSQFSSPSVNMSHNTTSFTDEPDTDLETDRLLGQQRTDDQGFFDDKVVSMSCMSQLSLSMSFHMCNRMNVVGNSSGSHVT
jgi:hypothetical protein